MESSPSTISPSSSNSTSHNLMQLDAYMSSLFDYEIETIEPIEKQNKKEQEQTEPLNFNLYGHIIQPISLDNPYAYTVNNTRAYDYTLYEYIFTLFL